MKILRKREKVTKKLINNEIKSATTSPKEKLVVKSKIERENTRNEIKARRRTFECKIVIG